MSTQEQNRQGSQPDKQGGGDQTGQEHNSPSRPKNPDNDPDQTPEREVKNPPKADPGKEQGKQPYK